MRKPYNLQTETSLLQKRFPIMISACLLGIICRYDGREATCSDLVDYVSSVSFIPFCPEQLGGLSTPRPPAKIIGGDGRDVISGKARLLNAVGDDVTDAFRKGAEEALNLARLSGASLAIMKDRSPSCGLKTPFCDKSTGLGIGVTAGLFESNGIKIFGLGKDDPFPCRNFLQLFEEFYSKSAR